MVTKWANAASAGEFRNVYATAVPKRYTVDAGAPGGGVERISASPSVELTRWKTADGPVELVSSGDTMIAIESLPAELVEKVRQAVLGK